MNLFCTMRWKSRFIVIVTWSLYGAAFASAQFPAVEAPNKLNAPSRALNPPEAILGSAVAEKPIALIYYANETSPDAAEKVRVETLTGWLRKTGNPEIAASADGIESDLREFPLAIEADIAAIKQGHAAAAKNRPAVVIFTNRLAHEGKLETAAADKPGAFRHVDFVIPSKRAGLYQAYPLSAHEVFEAALRQTKELYPPDKYEYVLISKSHGAPNLVLTPKYQTQVAATSRERFVEKSLAVFVSQLAAKLKDAAPLYVAVDEKLLDDQGRSVVVKDGVLYWEQVGKLQILSDAQVLYLADRAGKPFVSADGKRLVVNGKVLRVEGSDTNLLDAHGKSVELLAALGRNLDHHPKPGETSLATSQLPTWFPLLRSALFANEVQTDKVLKIPLPEGGFVALPLRKRPTGSKEETPAGDEAWMLHQAQFIRTAEQLQVPLLDTDELVAPLVSVGRKVSPLLAVNKWIGDSRLGVNMVSDLDPDDNNTLDPDDNNTLDPDDNNTLGIAESGSSPKKAKRYGTSKTQYVAALERQGKAANMYFRLVFLESCQSQLSNDLLKRLRTRGTTQIGQVWSSDARGLKYSTCDYGRAFAALNETASFSEALSRTLENQFTEEQRVRDELLK